MEAEVVVMEVLVKWEGKCSECGFLTIIEEVLVTMLTPIRPMVGVTDHVVWLV